MDSKKGSAATWFLRSGVIVNYNHFWIAIVSQAGGTVELILAFCHSQKLLCDVQEKFLNTAIRLGRRLEMCSSHWFRIPSNPKRYRVIATIMMCIKYFHTYSEASSAGTFLSLSRSILLPTIARTTLSPKIRLSSFTQFCTFVVN